MHQRPRAQALALPLTVVGLAFSPAPASLALGQSGTTTITVPMAPTVPPGVTVVSPPAAPTLVMPGVTTAASTTTTETATPARRDELPSQPFAGAELLVLADPEAKAKAAQEKQQRLQKIRQLSFDRRPSAILRAWSRSEADERAEAEAARAKMKAALPPGAAEPAEPDPFDLGLRSFARSVTLGDWPAAGTFLKSLPEDESKALYLRLLQALPAVSAQAGMPMSLEPGIMAEMGMSAGMQVPPNIQQFAEKSTLSNADVIALAGLAPAELEEAHVAALGRLLALALQRGHAVEDFVARAEAETAKAEGDAALTRRLSARILAAAGQADRAGPFLPTPERAEADDDREALNLLSQHYLGLHAREPKAEHLEQAWKATQGVLAVGQVDREAKAEALKRAVDLAPKIRDELGEEWLARSFTDRPERGMEILAAIGAASAQGIQLQPFDAAGRLKALQLQKTAVEALLSAAPDRARDWKSTLDLLASAWLAEARFSHQYDYSTSLGPRMYRDSFGNIYFNDEMMPQEMMNRGNMPRAITVAQVLEVRPADGWLALIDDALQPEFARTFAQLYLKVGEEALAFPSIERLAASHPRKAKDLAEEFLRVWTRNHDPNAQRNYTNPYMFMYGFERRAESIPLTRSKQERNLKELADWVGRLRDLPIEEVDQKLLAGAFTASHSAAEVYRVEALESVFGSLDALKPETLAELVQRMRTNLAGVWRQPAVQEQAKTRRKEKDIRAEVLRGYEVARAVTEEALRRHPDHWALVLARAALMHDENNYRQELDPDSDFTRNRRLALEEFARSAALYAAKVPDLAEDEESVEPYETWFYAGLGACDLGAVTEKTLPIRDQPDRVREAILALPGPAAGRHMEKFANNLFTRMSAANPAVKHRYLTAGFAIVGDHPRAHEARKVYDYYKDLVTEIKLDARVDGPDDVGSGKPFGLFVDIRHTREIERESGGFGRYLQNQNNTTASFYYNYGRPLENYRDKFEEAAREVLKEQFEVLSVTFQEDKVNSRATEEYGWRFTPYAYLLLKARSPEVDKIPPLRLDLDFLDTSGYAILPVESPAIPIAAGTDRPPVRPFEELKITQTLDERQAKDGKLILEVKATARGLVPELDELLEIAPEGFEVAGIDDQGLSVVRFDPESEENAVQSERLWLVSLRGVTGPDEPPSSFAFPVARLDDAEVVRQRYDDADLAEVGEVVDLQSRYAEPDRSWIWWTGAGLAALAILAVAVPRVRPRAASDQPSRYRVPDLVTPFTVLALLREVRQDPTLTDARRADLDETIAQLERHYFAVPDTSEPDLRRIAEDWARS